MSSNNWISVNDRLPELNTRVLLNVSSIGQDYTAIGLLKSNGMYYKDKGTLSKPMESITHWQPLPEPPTQKTNE